MTVFAPALPAALASAPAAARTRRFLGLALWIVRARFRAFFFAIAKLSRTQAEPSKKTCPEKPAGPRVQASPAARSPI